MLFILAGAPGSGKTTTAAVLAARLSARGPTVHLNLGDHYREPHLRGDWGRATETEEDMSVRLAMGATDIYLSHGYTVVLDDLRDRDAVTSAQRWPGSRLVSMVAPDDVLRHRLAERTAGFRDADAAMARNAAVRERALVRGELRFDTSVTDPVRIADIAMEARHAAL